MIPICAVVHLGKEILGKKFVGKANLCAVSSAFPSQEGKTATGLLLGSAAEDVLTLLGAHGGRA